jgi:hypothetical protein
MNKHPTQGYINHIAIVLDGSLSMSRFARDVVAVTDGMVSHLAERSTVMDQETRATVYVFNEAVPGVKQAAECVFYDRDVLRLPSIAEHYRAERNTALIDATMTALDDLAKTPEIYGDHAFLVYVITDGEENRSRIHTSAHLSARLRALPDNWTVAVMVPNQMGVFEAKRFGFAADNIAVWDTTSAHGVREVGNTIRAATDRFMANRAQGVRGSRAIFSTGIDAVNRDTVRSTLTPLPGSAYTLTTVTEDAEIRDWVVDQLRMDYRIGAAFYELKRRVTIQRTKRIAVHEKKTGVVYVGDGARDILGLPDIDTRVSPDINPEYTIFVQSTSVNRKMYDGDKLLIIPAEAR